MAQIPSHPTHRGGRLNLLAADDADWFFRFAKGIFRAQNDFEFAGKLQRAVDARRRGGFRCGNPRRQRWSRGSCRRVERKKSVPVNAAKRSSEKNRANQGAWARTALKRQRSDPIWMPAWLSSSTATKRRLTGFARKTNVAAVKRLRPVWLCALCGILPVRPEIAPFRRTADAEVGQRNVN